MPLPHSIRLALADILSGLGLPGRVSSPKSWHITLRFLGEIEETTYERFLANLDQEDLGGKFRIGLNGFGTFPGPKRAKVFWAGIGEGSGGLARLAAIGEEAAVGAGLEPEERPYRPHLTLTVVRPAQDLTKLMHKVPDVDLRWECDRVVAYQSHLGRGPARYEALDTLPLQRQYS